MQRSIQTVLGQKSWGAVLMTGVCALAIAACGESTTSTVNPPFDSTAPSITLTSLVPSTLRLGDPFQFTLSAQIQTPGGIRSQAPVLITVAPPLGSRVGVITLDAGQIPGCGGGSIVCSLSNFPVTVTQVPLQVTGSYEVTISVLDQQGRVAQSSGAITATL
jgi:hypothetical protein